MKILSIIKSQPEFAEEKIRAFASQGADLDFYRPGTIRIFAPLSLSKIIDKNRVDIIEVTSIDDAMVALSAIDISRHKCKVAVKVEPNSSVPRGIPTEICRKVAVWIFPSERLLNKYTEAASAPLQSTKVVQPTSFKTLEIDRKTECNLTLTSIGTPRSTERLKAIVDGFDRLCGKGIDAQLRICGEGKPTIVMPAVKHSRYLDCHDRISWTGADYNPADEISKASICISSNDDISEEETLFIANGIPIIEPENISSLPETIISKNSDKEAYTPCFHVEQVLSSYRSALLDRKP